MEQPPKRLTCLVKNTFLELEENDSDDSLEPTSGFARAATEPAKATPHATAAGFGVMRQWSPTEPQYVYTQTPAGSDHGRRDEHQSHGAMASMEGMGERMHDSLGALERDAELSSILESIKLGGNEVALQLYQNEELMQKLSKKMFDVSSKKLTGPFAQPLKLDMLGLAKMVFQMEETLVLRATLDAVRMLPCAVTLADPSIDDCPLIGCSEAFEQLSGYSQSEILGRNCRFLNRGSLEAAARQRIHSSMQNDTEFIGVLLNVRKNGEHFLNLLRLTTMVVGGKKLIVGIQSDVSGVGIKANDPVHIEELEHVATCMFAANIDTCLQFHAREFSIQQRVPCSELFRTKYPQHFSEMQRDFVVLKWSHQINATDGVTAAWLAQRSHIECPGSLDGHPAARLSDETVGCDAATFSKALDTVPNQTRDTNNPAGHSVPLKSLGSAGHPDNCGTECIFYFFRNGCKAGADCRFCHEFHQRKNLKKNRRVLKKLAGQLSTSTTGMQAATTNEGALTRTIPTEALDQMTLSMSDSVSVSRQVSPDVLRFCYGAHWPTDGNIEKLTLVVGQQAHIPVHLDTSCELKHMFPQGLTFTVEPVLPRGLTVNGCTGLICGAPMVALGPCVYTFSVTTPSSSPGDTSPQVPQASFRMIINVVDLRQFNLAWCCCESEANDCLRLNLSLRQVMLPAAEISAGLTSDL